MDLSRWQRPLLMLIGIAFILLSIAWFSTWRLADWMMERQSRQAEMHVVELAPGLLQIDSVLRGRQIGATTLALVGDQGLLLVDPPMTEALTEKLFESLPPRVPGSELVVITSHNHPDHARGLRFLPAPSRSLASRATIERLGTSVRPFPLLPPVPPLAERFLPEQTVDSGGQELSFNGTTVEIWALAAAHTDGDLAVFFRDAKVVHVGDVFHGVGGRAATDWSNSGGRVRGQPRTLQSLLDRVPTDGRLVGGHGGVGQSWSREDLFRYRELYERLLVATGGAISDGASLEEAQQRVTQELGAFLSAWLAEARDDSVMHSSTADGWIENVYRGLIAESDS